MIGKFMNIKPKLAGSSLIAASADIIGAVEIGKYSSVWFNVVVRADINRIKIGAYTNVQDGSVLHVDDDEDLRIGNYVTIGHNCILHACAIGDACLIGMGSIILNGAKIGKGSIVAAGCLITKDFEVPAYTLVMGAPGKLIRKVSEEEKKKNIYWAKKYAKLISEYKKRKA
jgi:carbonic anhydrase/acetyltransferase-like protein (isoleucine patch superfamily)